MIWIDKFHYGVIIQNCEFCYAVTENLTLSRNVPNSECLKVLLCVKYEPIKGSNCLNRF